MKILLADDSTHAQRMGAKILAGEGIEVVSVSNGEAAVKKLQDTDFDLILADVYMPGLDGYEVCQWVKKSEAHTGLPVVLVVGALEIYEADRVEQVHADGLLKKPFEASAMLATIRPLLEASIASRPLRKKPEPDHDATVATHEKTVVVPPPMPKHDDTVEIEAKDQPTQIPVAEPAPPPPPAPPPAYEPPPVAAAPAAVAEAPAPFVIEEFPAPLPPEPEPEPFPPAEEPPPPMAEMEIPFMSESATEAASASEFPPMAEMETHSFEEQTTADFTIPDIVMEEEHSVEIAPPQETAWVAQPAQVTEEDRKKFEEPVAPAAPTPVAAPAASPAASKTMPEAPPDWGELLKSVEEGAAHLPAASPAVAVQPAALSPAAGSPAAGSPAEAVITETVTAEAPKDPAATGELVLEMAEPSPPPPPAPEIDEEELRMAVQLCLENALPGLVDEITAAVMRRIGHSG